MSRSAARSFGAISLLLVVAVAVSALLYQRTRSADFDAHARAIASLGEVRRDGELLSKEVLAARFGLLNQYDSLNATEVDLKDAAEALRGRMRVVTGADTELDRAQDALEESIEKQRLGVEQFKADNSVLKNSVYYLPTLGREIEATLEEQATLRSAVERVASAALLFHLVGDESARAGYATALAEVEAHAAEAPEKSGSKLGFFLAHARVIRDEQPAVDGEVRDVIDGDVETKLDEVDRIYVARFTAAVARSNVYRVVLYGWSLLLAIAVGAAGLQLRRVYLGLERRVEERTAALEKALDALWGEMRLAQKIQQSLVPATPTLVGCDVAAAMRAAEKVGGDYYDVVTVDGVEWILVGDVSGHGVPAGLVMMMCQTAVRTVLRGDAHVQPDALLARVNTVLTANIRQLGEDKYMTMTAFRRDRDGVIAFAGAHQDLFVYRAETDSVEILETSGAWLGIKESIELSLKTRTLTLSHDDVLVLHTDGITEAMRDGALFDTAGLRAVLERARGKSAQRILDEVFSALDGFDVTDDATLIVIRNLASV